MIDLITFETNKCLAVEDRKLGFRVRETFKGGENVKWDCR